MGSFTILAAEGVNARRNDKAIISKVREKDSYDGSKSGRIFPWITTMEHNSTLVH